MKLLLVNPPSELEFSLFVLEDYNSKARSAQAPLWALYLHAYLKDRHDIEIFDMGASDIPIEAIKDKLDSFQPDLIGISTVIAKWLTVRELAKQIKFYTDTLIVLGGVNVSLYPWESLQYPYIDYVVSGYGQVPLSDLCNALENNLDVDNIPHVHTRNNCKEKIKGDFSFIDVDEFPMPDRSILPVEDYVMPFFPGDGPVSSMVTSFGCYFKCFFCACKNYNPVILRKTENIINEMKHIQNLGIKGVLVNDELFTMSVARIRELCNAIIDNDIHLNISIRSRANLVHEESLELLKKAGVFNIHLGIESGTDRILTRMNKKIDVAMVRRSVAMIKAAGLSVTASFMLGYVDESKEEILQTIQFAKDLELNNSQFFITQPESNTELYCQLKEIKNLPEDIYSDFTADPTSADLKNSIASTVFTKEEMDDFLRYAYTQTVSLYDIKSDAANGK